MNKIEYYFSLFPVSKKIPMKIKIGHHGLKMFETSRKMQIFCESHILAKTGAPNP